MRRLLAILFMVLLGLSLPGCSLFKKNTGGGSSGAGDYNPPNVPPPKFPTSNDSKADPLNGQSRAPGGNGMLAGRVLDGGNRPPGGTSILIVNADAKDDSGRELSVSPEGYFTIENLNSGGQYKLIARGKQGDRTVAGIHYATAPNVHVLIQMKDDFVSTTTPNVQGPFGSLNDGKKFDALAPQAKQTPAKDGWRPGQGIDVASSEVTLPAMQVAVGPDGFMSTGTGWIPPPLSIPNPKAKAPEIAKITPPEMPARTPDAPTSLDSAQVPSCVLVGRQLVNFALNDVNGEAWELKANRKGSLVLLDFWGSWCVPCRQTMPALKGLQSKYGAQGLEVVGIAYEMAGSPQEQAYKVTEVTQKLLINYRQLLGSGPNCVVKTQLGVRAFPTLVLIDEQGTILWRHEGRPSSADLEELERLIQSKTRGAGRI